MLNNLSEGGVTMRGRRQTTVRTVGAVAIAALVAALLVTIGAPATPAAADGNEAPGSLFGFRSITAGGRHSCAITAGGSVKCWGFNLVGQLGLGDAANHGDGPNELGDNLPTVNLGTGRTATAISAGYAFTCALLDNATVKCWGHNTRGQLGQGDTANRGDGPNEMGDNLPTVNLGTGRTATAISTGENFACALLDNATFKCWGANDAGQLGLGDTANRGDGPNEMGDNLPTVNLGAARTATAITTGEHHSCALLDDATAKCWGKNAQGQLGLGDSANRGDAAGEMGDNLPAISLGAGRTATAITAGGLAGEGGHTCALLDNATVKCWGYNGTGQLGLGDTADRGDSAGEMGDNLPVVNLGAGRTATAVSAAGVYTCVRLDNATVKCWGYNDSQLGLGDTANRGDGPNEMGDNLPTVNLGAGRTATAVTTGDLHTCALLDNASVKCWGYNDDGELGLGDTAYRGDQPNEMGDSLLAVDLGSGGGRGVVSVGAGATHSCALLEGGSVRCWGDGTSGLLGLGDTVSRGDGAGEMGNALPSVSLGAGRSATALAVGDLHSCALLDNGTVKCWGDNQFGQLGVGDTNDRGDNAGEMGDALLAVPLGTGRTATAISVGYGISCARLDNGTAKCWGRNTSGQLGQGDTANRGDAAGELGNTLLPVALGTGRTVTQLSAGDDHTCARLDNGTVKCWGYAGEGRLGLGDLANRGDSAGEMGDALPAVALGTGRTATSVSAGAAHTCARLDNATVKCWGFNNAGQLGRGDTANRGGAAGQMGDNLAAISLGTGRTALSVDAGGVHTCARLDNSAVKCWGANASGQLGLGDVAFRGDGANEMGDNLPTVALGTGRTAAVLSAGVAHTCARLDDGTAKCWGENATGQLGRGNTLDWGNGSLQMGILFAAIDLGGTAAPTGITGRLTDTASSAPISGAFVLAMRTSDFSIVGGAVTDGAGNYTAYTPPGTFFLYLIDRTGAHTAAFNGAPGATPVTVPVDTVTTANPTATSTRGTINGTVTEEVSNLPIAGATVLSLGGPNVSVEAATTANGAGGFTLTGLRPGSHWIGYLDPTGTHRTEFHPNSPDVPNATPVATTAGSVTVASGQLAPQPGTGTGAALTGTLTEQGTGAPITGALVVALNAADFRLARSGFTDTTGAYNLNVAVSGTYKLAFIDPTGHHNMEWHNNQPNTGLGNATTVNAPAATNATLDPTGGTITGTITDQTTAQPIPNTIILAIGPTGITGATTTTPNGTYTITGLPPGTYRTAFVDPTGNHTIEYFDNQPDFGTANTLNITPGTTLTGVDATLTRT